MATFDYSKLKTTAETLLTKFGQSATLRQQTAYGDDWAPQMVEADTTITVVDDNIMTRDADGLVGRTRRTLYISTAAGVTPAKGDKVVVGGTEHEIGEVRTVSPGGTACLFEADLVT